MLQVARPSTDFDSCYVLTLGPSGDLLSFEHAAEGIHPNQTAAAFAASPAPARR